MTEEIKQIIEKNLPAQVGEVLKVTLEQGRKDALTVKSQLDQLLQLRRDLGEKEALIAEYKKFDGRNAQLDARQEQIEIKERSLEIESLNYRLDAEINKTQFVKNVAMGLVRNVDYRQSIFENRIVPTGEKDQYGNILYINESKNSTHTQSID